MFGDELKLIVNNKQIIDDYCKIYGLDLFSTSIEIDESEDVTELTGGTINIQKGGDVDIIPLPEIVNIEENDSVMLGSLSGARLGIWVAHGEGRFEFPYFEDKYLVPVKYTYGEYPGNPNGSDFDAAAICSNDGRHLAMMPHLERAIYPWQWAYYPEDRPGDEVSPWIEAFVNARKWIEKQK